MAPDLDLVLFAMHCRRLHRKKIKCTACNKVIYSEYKADQLKRKQNNNLSVKFVSVKEDSVDFLQKKLCFATATIISSSASIAADNSTYLTSASLAVTGSISCELDKCEESVSPNKNVFELTTATEVQERLDETVVQLKDQDNDLHEVVNGDAGDKEEDFQQIQRFLLFLLILRWLKMFQMNLKTKIMKQRKVIRSIELNKVLQPQVKKF